MEGAQLTPSASRSRLWPVPPRISLFILFCVNSSSSSGSANPDRTVVRLMAFRRDTNAPFEVCAAIRIGKGSTTTFFSYFFLCWLVAHVSVYAFPVRNVRRLATCGLSFLLYIYVYVLSTCPSTNFLLGLHKHAFFFLFGYGLLSLELVGVGANVARDARARSRKHARSVPFFVVVVVRHARDFISFLFLFVFAYIDVYV